MNKMNIYTLLICNNLSIFFILLLSKTSSAADHYLYDACKQTNCSAGPNISYPFYIGGPHESHCGYPGFGLNCSSRYGLPTLQLNGHEYVVEQIFYQNHTFHVYNAAVLGSENKTCFPGIQNTTLPLHMFDYVSTTARVYLFSGCQKPLPDVLQRYNVSNCDGYWDLAIYGGDDENLGSAMKICKRNVVVPVDGGDRGRNGNINVSEVVRRGFTLHWKASDCSVCGGSGGHCGFNRSNYHFLCLCSDRPHRVRCNLGAAAQRCG